MSQRPGKATEAIPVPSYATGSVQPPGWVLGDRYTVLDRLGSGGMADVFRAHDEQLDRDVAVKVFRTPVDEPGNAHTPERRETELHVLAQLSHPNLITLYDANIGGASPAFLVTELVIGPNLAARIAEGPIPEDLARTIGVQIADALAYVHASGMVHRDVKPANILLGTDGPDPVTATVRARLSDFGIVRVLDDARMTAAEFTLGTASYIAPEQARGGDVGPPADVYALGLVLLETLTGRRSFDGPMHEAVAARLVRGPEIPPGLPQPWPGLLAAMTASDPAHRPGAAEVAESLRSSAPPAFVPAPMPLSMPDPGIAAAPTAATVVTGPISPAVPAVGTVGGPPGPPLPGGPADEPYPPGPPPKRSRRTGVLVGVGALVLLAVVAVAALLVFKPASHTAGPAGSNTPAPTTTAGNGGGGQSTSNGHRPGGSAPAVGPVAAVSDSSGDRPHGPSDSGAPSRPGSGGGGGSAGSTAHSSAAHSSPPGGRHPRTSSTRPAPSTSRPRPSPSTSKSTPGGHTSSPPSSSPTTSASAPTSSAAAAPSGGAGGSGQPG